MMDVNMFHHMVLSPDGTLVREKFEWRHSGDPEVKALATENIPGENVTQDNRGLKLVQASTGLDHFSFQFQYPSEQPGA